MGDWCVPARGDCAVSLPGDGRLSCLRSGCSVNTRHRLLCGHGFPCPWSELRREMAGPPATSACRLPSSHSWGREGPLGSHPCRHLLFGLLRDGHMAGVTWPLWSCRPVRLSAFCASFRGTQRSDGGLVSWRPAGARVGCGEEGRFTGRKQHRHFIETACRLPNSSGLQPGASGRQPHPVAPPPALAQARSTPRLLSHPGRQPAPMLQFLSLLGIPAAPGLL